MSTRALEDKRGRNGGRDRVIHGKLPPSLSFPIYFSHSLYLALWANQPRFRSAPEKSELTSVARLIKDVTYSESLAERRVNRGLAIEGNEKKGWSNEKAFKNSLAEDEMTMGDRERLKLN